MLATHTTCLAALLYVAALAQSPAPTPAKPPVSEIVYPTLEPFRAARFTKEFYKHPELVDLAELLKEATDLREVRDVGKAAGEQATGKTSEEKVLSAHLEPVVEHGGRLVQLPLVLLKLEPLWKSEAWGPADLELARAGAKIVELLPDGPKLAFADGKPKENHKELEKLVRYYDAQVARPERYAAMILSMDDGPYVGLPYETTSALSGGTTRKLDDKTELRLTKVDRPGEAWVLQCVREGKPLWSRVISGAPDGVVQEVALSKSEPQKLGTYGWKVFLDVKWTYGAERGYLYLDPKAGLLFYFLTW